jgi:AcrR family transcriptional regulator
MSPRTDKQEAILDAALALFAARGFHGTAVPDLATAAGVGAGTIYRYFDSKEALVNALYRRWKRALMTEVFAAVPLTGSWRSRFRELWSRLFRFDRDHPGAIDFLDLHHHGDYLDDQSRAVEAQSAAAFIALVQQMQREEVIVDLPPPAVIAMVYSSFLGLLRAEREGWLRLDEPTIEATEERAWAMIRR